MSEKENLDLMMDIVKRADELGLMALDRMSLKMDLEVADEEYSLRLEDLLKADNFNFSHDIVGIQNHIDRENRKMIRKFLPRFAGQ